MILQDEICHIEINIDETYTVDSVDNPHYDVTLNLFDDLGLAIIMLLVPPFHCSLKPIVKGR